MTLPGNKQQHARGFPPADSSAGMLPCCCGSPEDPGSQIPAAHTGFTNNGQRREGGKQKNLLWMLIKPFPLVSSGELQLHGGSCTPAEAELWNLISSLFIPLRSANCRLAKDVCQAVTSLQPLKVQVSAGTNTSCHQRRRCYRCCCSDLGLTPQRDFENKTSEKFGRPSRPLSRVYYLPV